jgi:beta-glucanase (GH16 family)
MHLLTRPSTGLVLGTLGTGSAAHAAGAPVTVKAISQQSVADGGRVTVTPRYSARKGVKVRPATVTVRRGSTWVSRGARSARLAPGTYRVTSRVAYQAPTDDGLGRRRTATRTQTLRVVAEPAAPPVTPAVAPLVASVVPSVARTGAACDASSLSKPDGTPWVCSFADEFAGTTLDRSRWMPQLTATSGYHIGADCYVDDPDNIAVGDGVLSLTVRRLAAPRTCTSPAGDYEAQHTAGMVSTWSSFSQARGRYEIRAAFPATSVAGHHSALWLYPRAPSPGLAHPGEIDIAEMFSNWSDRVIPYLHYASGWDATVTNNYCMIDDVSAFHTYTLEWTATTMTIAYDGVPCVTHRINGTSPGSPSPFDDDPFMVVLTQGLGLGDNSPTSATPPGRDDEGRLCARLAVGVPSKPPASGDRMVR